MRTPTLSPRGCCDPPRGVRSVSRRVRHAAKVLLLEADCGRSHNQQDTALRRVEHTTVPDPFERPHDGGSGRPCSPRPLSPSWHRLFGRSDPGPQRGANQARLAPPVLRFGLWRLTDNRDVERVILGCAVARLAGDDTDVAGVVSGRTGTASWWAATRASADCPTIADIGGVRRRDNDELAVDGTAEVEDVGTGRRLRCRRDSTRLRDNRAVSAHERPARCRSCRSRWPSRAGRAWWPGLQLPRFEILA